MSHVLDFFVAGPARVKGLLLAALAMAVVILALLVYALWWRGEAYQARAARDVALAQVDVLAAAAKACSSSVEHAHQVGEAAIAATEELVAAAARLELPAVHTIERTEKIIERPAPPGAGCDQAWDAIEADRAKANAGAAQ